MGHSAGGHLALLYAYMAKQGYYNYGDKIELVISETGPTDFTGEGFYNLSDQAKAPVMALVNNNASLLSSASPITHAVGDNLPFTIYARGEGDVTTKVDQVISLVKKLLPSYANEEDLVIETALINNTLTDETNCAFFSFPRLGHDNFGATGSTGRIHPNPPDTEEFKDLINAYYNKISEKLI